MKTITDQVSRRERVIAGLLWYGTGIASVLVAAGLLLTAFEPSLPLSGVGALLNGYTLVKAGVAVFIFLPVARVALMLALFLRERDYAYAVIAALVLTIIAMGIIIEK